MGTTVKTEFQLGDSQALADSAWDRFTEAGLLKRIWQRDHTVWAADPKEISNRLDWLDSPVEYGAKLAEIQSVAEGLKAAGFTQCVLMGMGGSSLAPEVFRKVFGVADGWLDLIVLDSTNPDELTAKEDWINLDQACFIVSTKSGGTVETLSLFKHFFSRICAKTGSGEAGSRFMAITDPGSSLEQLAAELGFRHVFLNNPNIGGRFSVFSYFGLVPAAQLGISIADLLEQGRQAIAACQPTSDRLENGAWLGIVLGELAQQGKDKLILRLPPEIAPLGAWLEQLIAESTGKHGKGILPVIETRSTAQEVYGPDQLTVSYQLAQSSTTPGGTGQSSNSDHPAITITLSAASDLVHEFFRWEMAVACACCALGVNPFDQPDVEAAKQGARAFLVDFEESGELPESEPTVVDGNIELFALQEYLSIEGAIAGSLGRLGERGYISIQAFIPRTRGIIKRLDEIAGLLRDVSGVPITIGFGPRYLHSTGQYHKGGPPTGLHLLLMADPTADFQIPESPGDDPENSSLSFKTLLLAQALGDEQALVDAQRLVLSFNLKGDITAALIQLGDHLKELNPA